MKVETSTASEQLCEQIHQAVKWITTHLGRYLGPHEGYEANVYNISGGTMWYHEDTGFTEIVLEHQVVFEADPDGRATTFVGGPWVAEVLALAKTRQGRAA